ncbi:hypothetical protein ACN9TI_14380 [Lactococcus lactis]
MKKNISVLKNKLNESSEAIEKVERKIEAVVEQYKYKSPSLEVKKKLEELYLQTEELKKLHEDIIKTIDQVEQISEYALGHKERLLGIIFLRGNKNRCGHKKIINNRKKYPMKKNTIHFIIINLMQFIPSQKKGMILLC